MKWEYKTLDQLGTVSRGKSKHRPRNDPKLFGGKYPFVQTADVKNADYYITKYSDTYNESGLAQSKLWDEGTLCITIAANIADTGVLAFPACFPDSIMGFVPFEGVANTRFIKYCFDRLQRDCKQISQGTAQDNLSWEKLSTIKFCIPEYKEQCRIADILSAYDDLIENNQKQIKLLEEAAQRHYKEWFVDLRFPGHENTKIVDGVPEGWSIYPFSSKVDIMSGGTPKTSIPDYYNGKIPFYTPKDNDGAFFAYKTQMNITEGGLKNCNSRLYPPKTVIITARGTVGKTTILAVPMAMNQSCYALKMKENDAPYYLFFALNNEIKALQTMANGGVFNTIIGKTFDSINIQIPKDPLIYGFEETVRPFMEQIKNKLQANSKLVEARDRLLPKLMSGEVEV